MCYQLYFLYLAKVRIPDIANFKKLNKIALLALYTDFLFGNYNSNTDEFGRKNSYTNVYRGNFQNRASAT